jgi:hypothetical protein
VFWVTRARDSAQTGQKSVKIAEDRPRTRLRWPEDGPQMVQDRPNIAQDRPKMGPKMAKIPQDRSKSFQNPPAPPLRGVKAVGFLLYPSVLTPS